MYLVYPGKSTHQLVVITSSSVMSAVDEAAVTAKSGGLGVIWGVVAEYCLLCPKKCASRGVKSA